MDIELEEKKSPGSASLQYEDSKVSWSVSSYLNKPDPLYERLYVYVLAGTLILGLLFSIFLKVAISVSVEGKLSYAKSSIPIITRTQLIVGKIMVEDNGPVKKGQPLLEAQSNLPEDQAAKLLGEINTITAKVSHEEVNSCNQDCFVALKTLAENSFRLASSQKLDADFVSQIDSLHKSLKEYLNGLQEFNALPGLTANILHKLKLNEGKVAEIEKMRAQKLLRTDYEDLQNEISSLKAQLKDKEISAQSLIQSSRSDLLIKLRSFPRIIDDYIAERYIRAPMDGVAQFSSLSGEGQVIGGGKELMTIAPMMTDLMAEITIPNKEISKIKKGQEVNIDLIPLPEREYGVLKGQVADILEQSTVKEGGIDGIDYKGIVKIKAQEFELDGEKYRFKSGMKLNAKIVTKYESLFFLGIKKLLNLKDEYLKAI